MNESSIIDSRDSPIDSLDEVKHALDVALQDVPEGHSRFSGYGPCKDMPDPEITIGNGLRLNLPLQVKQADQVISFAHRAPFGKGLETVVDTDVRRTWEINKDQLNFSENGKQRWEAWMGGLRRKIGEELGLERSVKAELYKMLIYEEGAMFKAHTDTEKIPGMFGTLVISLGSAHYGGSVVLRHGGREEVYHSSEYVQSYAYWYSDVSHEVKPVTSGYRLVLTYNLAVNIEDAAISKPQAADASKRSVRGAMALWQERVNSGLIEGDQPLIYLLQHKYTEANMNEKSLKGEDKARLNVLKHAAGLENFDVLLAHVQKREWGNCEGGGYAKYGGRRKDYDDDESGWHELMDVFEEGMTITAVKALSGPLLAAGRELDWDDIIQEENEMWFDDGEENYNGFMGNSGPDAEHIYKESAIIIVPIQHVLEFLREGAVRTDPYLTHHLYYIRSQYFAGRGPAIEKPAKALITKAVGAKVVDRVDKHNILIPILTLGFKMKDFGLINDVVDAVDKEIGIPTSLWEWLINNMFPCEDFEEYIPALRQVFRKMTFPSEKFLAVSYICGEAAKWTGPLSPGQTLQLNFHREVVCYVLQDIGSSDLLDTDGQNLAFFVFHHCGNDFLLNQLLPVLRKRFDKTVFLFGFLLRNYALHHSRKSLEASPGVEVWWKDLMSEAIMNMKFETQETSESNGYTSRLRLTIETLRQILSTLQGKALTPLALALLDKLRQYVEFSEPPTGAWINILLPLLWYLPDILREGDITLADNKPIQDFYKVMLQRTRELYVGYMPSQDHASYSILAQVTCSKFTACMDCERLNDFLQDSTSGRIVMVMSKVRRHHIHQRIDSTPGTSDKVTHVTHGADGLNITKLKTVAQEDMKAWESRQCRARGLIAAIDQDALKEILGEQLWKDLVDEPFGIGRSTMNSMTRGEMAARWTKRAADDEAERGLPKRMKASQEVIDLTGDS